MGTQRTLTPRLIFVLGMHRSGTSCLTGLLGDAGVWLGPVEKGSPHNIKGNNENRQVMNLNKAVLAANDSSWFDPPAGDAAWSDEHRERARDLLGEILAPGRVSAMKDPRSLYTGRGWMDEARSAGAQISAIGTFRRPERVVASLRARDPELDPQACHDLWCRYNERLLEFHDAEPFPVLDFDVDEETYLSDVRGAFVEIGHAPPETLAFFEGGLRHHDDSVARSARATDLLAELERRRIRTT